MIVATRRISPLSLLKCGLAAPKIAEVGNFWYKFAQKGKRVFAQKSIPLKRFLQNLGWGGSPRFAVALKMWDNSHQNRKNW